MSGYSRKHLHRIKQLVEEGGYTIYNREMRKALRYIHGIAESNGFDDKYCIVGGIAVQLHLYKSLGRAAETIIRKTDDIDLITERTPKGMSLYELLLRGCQDFEYRRDVHNLKIGNVWVNVNIDESSGVPPAYFQEIIKDSCLLEIPGNKGKHVVRVISLEDLILTKLDTYVTRKKREDLEDIENLITFCKPDVNKMNERVEKYFKEKEKFMQAYKHLLEEIEKDKNE